MTLEMQIVEAAENIDIPADEITAPADTVEGICRQINARWQDSVRAIIEIGHMLIAAKGKCEHGQWQWMFSDVNPDKLPFGDRTARRLMEVSRHPTLSNRTHGSDLPASWRTLYDLSKLPEDKLEAAFTEGRIHPDMERKDVKRLMYGHGGEDNNLCDEWYTPKWLFDALGLTFDLDVCGPADRTHIAVPCHDYLTEADDGLVTDWHGLIWCNPPYSTPAPWAEKCIAHGEALLLTHIPMNAEWAADVWRECDGLRLFQAIEFVRPDGAVQRPGMWLQLAAFGERARRALEAMQVPPEVAENPRRVPSPMFGRTA